jgi:SAM-dependent methyltransferase
LTDYLARNRESWTKSNAEYTDARARESWLREEIAWGMTKTPEDEVQMLPDVSGKDVIELGCGTGYFGAWLARRGARVTGVDLTPAQLETARRCSEELGIPMELVEANAEDVPLPGASFDVAVSEYGASIWCDPERWVPEAARLLRPGGELVFLRNTTLAVLCFTDESVSTTLQRPQRGLHRLDWEDDGTTEFQMAHSDWVRVLRESRFEILGLAELYAGEDAEAHPYYSWDAEWARRWPWEEIWRARKTA